MKLCLLVAVFSIVLLRCQAQDEECVAVGGECFKTKRCKSGYDSAGKLGGRCRGRGRKCCIRQTTCEESGGQCLKTDSCPAGTTSAGPPSGKCQGEGMKCCLTVTTTTTTTTTTTPARCMAVLDLVFVMDVSGSISAADFGFEKDFVKRTAGELDLGQGKVHTGLVKFSSSGIPEIGLDELFTMEEFNTAVDNAADPGGQSRTYLGIQAAQNMLTSQGRPNVPKVMVVMADGPSLLPSQVTVQANAAKAAGTTILTVGIDSSSVTVNSKARLIAELRAAATQTSNPPDQNHIFVDSFADLASITMDVADLACKLAPTTTTTTTPAPTSLCVQEGGECLDRPDATCPKGWFSAGPPSGKCTGENMKCCIHDPTRKCVEAGGQCFPDNTCPSGFQSVGGEPMKCVGSEMKCCRAVPVVE